MPNNLVTRIDMPHVNEDGTIEIIDIPSWTEFSFTFQYKLYLTFEENLQNIFQRLFSIPPENYELSNRFLKYIENRKKLYEEVSKEYLPRINKIMQSPKLSIQEKNKLIKNIDLEINLLYPYEA